MAEAEGHGIMNVYCIKPAWPEVQTGQPEGEASWIYVVASSTARARDAVLVKHPNMEIREIKMLNCDPVLTGD
jgi:hypothetical protein